MNATIDLVMTKEREAELEREIEQKCQNPDHKHRTGHLTLNQSVMLNIIFIISTAVGFFVSDSEGRNIILVTVVALFLFVPTALYYSKRGEDNENN